ncbi:transposase [Desulfolithobacter dissulfuricans]|uniref:Transposase n=1 Tax=Desulfolithobacter dissulfuricans TaxID=2795293 RepID=A0A915XJQ5_9BACT|nr:IS66 family transposase [Desulfolithobacter dissulfuricans]BCO08952.1 transposase [Desulfolithobacter dissulfuricans]
MKIDVSTLPEDSEQLKQILIEVLERHDRETSILHEQIRHLRALLFSRTSEKTPVVNNKVQLPLFDMPEPSEVEPADPGVEVAGHTRRKRGRKPLPEDLPRVEVVHDLEEQDRICGCGCELTRIGEEVSEQLDIVPARVQVIRHIRPKYACRNCEGVQDEGPTVKVAPPPAQIIPKSIATAGLLAHILVAKFVDHLPFYRQEKLFARIGVELSRASMCNWAMQVAKACQPLLNLLQEEVLAGSYIHADETTVQVLKEPGRKPTSKSYMWIFQRGDPDRQVLIYQYHPTRSGDVARNFLDGFRGYVQTDGYSGYDFLDQVDGIRHVGCWAHARRKFKDVVRAQGKNRKRGSADKALGYISRLYSLEKKWKKTGLIREEIHRLRQEQSRPILDDFYRWLVKRSSQTPPKGLLGQAISYSLRQWDRLVGYLEDGRLSMDNNRAENSIRPFVVGRKNWLFSGTPEGAEASALIYSLVETARANGQEPYSYLRYIFEKIPLAATLEDCEAMLPWNIDPRQLIGQLGGD